MCLREGQFVWLFNNSRKKGLTPKLQCRWLGPFLIIKKLSDVVFRIQQSPRGKPKVVHFDRLKPYEGDPLKPWGTENLNTEGSSSLPVVEQPVNKEELVNEERPEGVEVEALVPEDEVESTDNGVDHQPTDEVGENCPGIGPVIPQVGQVGNPPRRNPLRQRRRPLRYR